MDIGGITMTGVDFVTVVVGRVVGRLTGLVLGVEALEVLLVEVGVAVGFALSVVGFGVNGLFFSGIYAPH